MNRIHESHQINLFTNNEDISPSPAVIFPLLQELSRFSLIPTFGQEVNALSGEMKQILIMTNPEQTYRVEFASGSIVINSMANNHDEFVEKSIGVLGEIQKIYPNKKFNRIALLNAQIFIDDVAKYERLYNELFTYKEVSPFEWDNRIALRKQIAFHNEEINSINSISRKEVGVINHNSGRPFDSVIFEIDSNTLPSNASFRFDLTDSIQVLRGLNENNRRSLGVLSRYIEL
ncbi:hypothetical protein [Lelliottia nimipressuralis]|uniref:hypothetical protein n=1 Tax=Lelliottia nimipressuralis TaxID=69220 RepID=UPI001E426795|nr:hypothetical protein [Lelliottia nimipressuralis]